MRRKLTYFLIWGCSTALWVMPLCAQADFIIEFLDGRKVTVGHYFEEGQTIKIYTPQGTVGFPKAEIKRIISADENQGGETPLEATLGHESATTPSAASPTATEEKAKPKTESERRARHKDLKAEREQ